MPAAAFEVIDQGARTTFQDAGRPGHAAEGIGRSGAADRASHRLANRLVGNAEDAVVLEVVLGGLRLRVLDTVRVALTGAVRPVTSRGARVAFHSSLTLHPGDELAIGHGAPQVYTYLAVAGGFVATRVLGSSATDLLSGVGPAPLTAGDLLHVGVVPHLAAAVDVAPVASPADPVTLTVHAGPRVDWFVPDALETLCTAPYIVSSRSTRVALRLEGAPIHRTRATELPSEGLVRGAVQIPPDGLPIVFGVDHPVTGGYPVLAVVRDADLDAAAQAEAGARVRFRLAAPTGGRATRPG